MKVKITYDWDENNKFINPYNFVPANNKTLVTDDSDREKYTGVLHCVLKTKTPIIIPDAEHGKKDAGEHYMYPFMSINNQPFIPASSLRGPVRSVYEAFTNSCFSTTKRDVMLTGRTSAQNAYNPGLLHRDGDTWKLYKAEETALDLKGDKHFAERDEDSRKLSYGDYVSFDTIPIKMTGKHGKTITRNFVNKISLDSTKYKEKGYVFIGEYGQTKKCERVFVEKEIISENVNSSVSKLKQILSIYQDPAVNKTDKHHGYRHLNGMLEKKGKFLPIWYEERSKDIFRLSFASVGRFAYENTMFDLLGEKKKYCTDRSQKCKACDLFGMTGDTSSSAGKVRFTDAVLHNPDKSKRKEVDLHELASPRISYLPFYTNHLSDYESPNATIKGRKFYWHSIPSKASYAEERTNLNSTMECIENAEFTFDVYYDRITKEQLDELRWILCIGENDINGNMCYKIGHAKPLGFGSVKIAVVSETSRRFENGKYTLTQTGQKDIDIRQDLFQRQLSKKVYDPLMTILNFKTLSDYDSVRYPYVNSNGISSAKENELAAHQWFSVFKKDERNKLPAISSKVEDMELRSVMAVKVKDHSDVKNENSSTAGYIGKIIVIIEEEKRAYGFIKSDQLEGKKEVYFNKYLTKEWDSLSKGDRVEFQIKQSQKGPQAVNVKKTRK